MAVQSPLPFGVLDSDSSRTTPSETIQTPFRPAISSASPVTSGASPATPAPLREPHFVRHKRAKRYVIRVRIDGSVRVTIPRWGSKREARAFADAQRAWILEQQKTVAGVREAHPQPMAPGRSRELREQASRELPARLLELAARFDLTVSRISIRNQRWRWGSCSRQGHICLNWRLVDMPPDVRDYVLIHELMHLRRMDHSPKFWALVAAACPEYQRARRWLREQARGMLEN
jgi:predicted metal-dependent hydrolase